MQEHCHTKLLATLYSLLAAVLPFAVTIRYSLFATRHSPFTIRCRFTIRRSHSLLATRYSPFAAVSARQEFRPPIFSGYATFENLPKFLPAEGGEGDEP
jgi:hypothetical protein